jgi:hypothetical protein
LRFRALAIAPLAGLSPLFPRENARVFLLPVDKFMPQAVAFAQVQAHSLARLRERGNSCRQLLRAEKNVHA